MGVIVSAEAVPWTMPKADPTWRFALGARPESFFAVIRLVTQEGIRGYGVAGEIPHLGYPFATVADIAQKVAQSLVGQDPEPWRLRMAEVPREWASCRPAVAGIEMALLDVAARLREAPVHRLWGGPLRRSIPVLRILSLKSPQETALQASQLVQAGYRYLKIKLDNQPAALDVDRIRAVRDAVGPQTHLTLDANQSYRPKEAVRLWRQVESEQIDLFEQPVNQHDVDGLKFVRDWTGCLVEADESADSVEQIWRLVEHKAVDAVSLKVLKLGGLGAMTEVAAILKAAGVQCRVGASVGSRLLSAAAMQFIAITPNIDYACEVGEFERLLNDPFDGLAVEDGCLQIGNGPGMGVQPKEGTV